ncbi:MAG: hypothetical protein JKX70_04810 [Phycisphaerales bacterium]|nr:hypothetical protein [Phycisphaerales bacterium]
MAIRATPSRNPLETVTDLPGQRPWLGIQFTCAGAYQRVFRSSDGEKYLARCPKCGKSITFRVGDGGTNQRFFDVSCR